MKLHLSYCLRYILTPLSRYAPNENFVFTKGSLAEMSCYNWYKNVYHSYFCPTCGCAILGTFDKWPVTAVNVRSIDNVDVDSLHIKKVDGRNLL